MEKVLLIGKFNLAFQEINNYLSDYYDVKICVDNHKMVKPMLEQNAPKAVVISLAGISNMSAAIFADLKNSYMFTPVICIGNDNEQGMFKEYLKGDNFFVMKKPEDNSIIVNTIEEVFKKGIVPKRPEEATSQSVQREERKTILLVDDNALQLRTLNDMLKQKYNVMMATSGMKALTMLGKRIPDVIFLDYEMPMCDGKMTLEMIREIDEAKNIPVVFLTGVKDKEHIEAVLALKPEGYLLKPASADKIYGILDKIFNA